MPNRCVTYARVSTAQQERGASLADQTAANRQLTAAKGFKIVGEYQDIESGASDGRAGYSAMCEHIADGGVDAVIVYTQDRLGRRKQEIINFSAVLLDRGIELWFSLDGRPAGKMASERVRDDVEAIFAEIEREAILRRTEAGRQAKAKAGKILANRPPYGYDRVGKGRDAELVIDEEESEVIHQIFKLYAYGDPTRFGARLSLEAIAKILNAAGVPCPSDRRKWPHPVKANRGWLSPMVYNILINPCYKGTYTAFSRRVTLTTAGKRRSERTPDRTIEIAVPAIIDLETWGAVQERVSEGRQKSPRKQKKEYLLARRVRCACGFAITGFDNKRQQYYRCGSRRSATVDHHCGLPNLNAGDVDALVWETVCELAIDPHYIRMGLQSIQEKQRKKLMNVSSQAKALERRRDEIENELERLLSLYERGNLPVAVLEKRYNERREELASISDQLDTLNASADTDVLTDKEIDALVARLDVFRDGIEKADYDQKCAVLDQLRAKFTVVMRDGAIFIHMETIIGTGVSLLRAL